MPALAASYNRDFPVLERLGGRRGTEYLQSNVLRRVSNLPLPSCSSAQTWRKYSTLSLPLPLLRCRTKGGLDRGPSLDEDDRLREGRRRRYNVFQCYLLRFVNERVNKHEYCYYFVIIIKYYNRPIMKCNRPTDVTHWPIM